MKKTFLRIMLFGVISASLIAAMFACAPEGERGETAAETTGKPEVPSYTGTLPDGTQSLRSGSFRLDFKKTSGGFGVYVVDAGDGSAMFYNDEPAAISIRSGVSHGDTPASAPYSSVVEKDGGYVCSAVILTEDGCELSFEDTYTVNGEGKFAASRVVTVLSSPSENEGFRSVFSLRAADNSVRGSSFFIPSIIYKDTKNMVDGSICSDLTAERVYVKETRTGLPLAMLRSESSGRSVAIAHLHPEITVNGVLGGGGNDEINGSLQYGSIGYTLRGSLSVDFCYPSVELPTVYYSAATSRGIFHPMKEGFSHAYTLSLIPAEADTYADAMAYTFREAYMAESPKTADEIDIDNVYRDNIDVFRQTYAWFGTGTQKSAGVPWSIDLKTGKVVEYTFQMGFVGQQTSVGSNLMRYGYESGDEKALRQGREIIDFWTSDLIMRGALPIVWWDPVNDATAGHSRGYPSFLRCVVDGMEGILDAYRLARAYGEDNEKWLAALEKTADFLVDNQNGDGSFYRAYNTNGTVCTDTSDRNFQGTSKINTPVAIRFLAKMYELTGYESYKSAALAAADYSYNTLYLGLEKYVGGTPDNANTVDKEAAIYAMYGFNAAYGITGDKKYLAAAEHAAASAMSWVYCYDFACPSSPENDAINPFRDGGVSGFSIIATGHSGADNYSAFMYYEMFKLYVYTGNEFYREAAEFLELNTKLSTDYDGKMGWRFSAIGPEATNVSDFDFGTVGVWLPWSGIANIKPIGYMRDTFGDADVRRVGTDLDALRAALDSYGVGGRLLK